MIQYNEALHLLEEIGSLRRLRSERIPVLDSVGRILASPIFSKEEIPSFTNSAMDGFAIFSSDTSNASSSNPVRIRVQGLVAAGDLQAYEAACANKSGVAVEIMTGAPLPTGSYDAVVKVEDVVVVKTPSGEIQAIEVSRPSRAGENVRLQGTDFAEGQLVIEDGVRIAPEHVLACASLGINQLNVKTLPKISLVSTGSELVPPDEPYLAQGMIRNSTGHFLLTALSQFGIKSDYLGIVRDDPTRYRKVLERALADGAEIFISTGAVSLGKFDFVSEVLKDMGATTYFHKAAIRPGKPILFAEFGSGKNKALFFGIPGNPVSTAVGLRFFVEPFIRSLLGLARENSLKASLIHDCPKPEGLRCFFKGKARVGSSGLEVEALKGQASYIVSALLDANCWVILPEEGTLCSAKMGVEIVPLHNAFEKGVLS